MMHRDAPPWRPCLQSRRLLRNSSVAWSEAGEVFIRQSVDSGANFAGAVNVSASTGTSAGALIAVQPDGVHIAWNDKSSGNGEILYRFGTTP